MSERDIIAQLFLRRCDPMDGSLPGFSIRGILQARILEWLPFPSPKIGKRAPKSSRNTNSLAYLSSPFV